MKWEKRDEFTWRAETVDLRANIDKVSGNHGFPYMWDVYPLPRPNGRWTPIGRGSCRKLADAKSEAEAVWLEHLKRKALAWEPEQAANK